MPVEQVVTLFALALGKSLLGAHRHIASRHSAQRGSREGISAPVRARTRHGLLLKEDKLNPAKSWVEISRHLRRKDRPRCRAKTRAGGRCQVRVEPGKRRCRFHGGLSTGPKTEAGRTRIAEAQRRRWQAYREKVQAVRSAGDRPKARGEVEWDPWGGDCPWA
jgi:hypothetical protein